MVRGVRTGSLTAAFYVIALSSEFGSTQGLVTTNESSRRFTLSGVKAGCGEIQATRAKVQGLGWSTDCTNIVKGGAQTHVEVERCDEPMALDTSSELLHKAKLMVRVGESEDFVPTTSGFAHASRELSSLSALAQARLTGEKNRDLMVPGSWGQNMLDIYAPLFQGSSKVNPSCKPRGSYQQVIFEAYMIHISKESEEQVARTATESINSTGQSLTSSNVRALVCTTEFAPHVGEPGPRYERYPIGYDDKRRIYKSKGRPKDSELVTALADFGSFCVTGVVAVLALVTSMAGVVTVLALLTSMAQCVVTLLGMVPARVLTAALILALVSQAEAVTCMMCHDGVPGCAGGIACPFYQTPIINNEILTSANGSHTEAATGAVTTLIVCATILPRAISRFLTRGVLDFFKSVARRAAPGAPVAVADLTPAEIVEAVRGGRVEIADAISEILSRLPTASAAEGARLNTIITALGQLDKIGAPIAGTGSASNGELWGAFTYAWTQAGRIVHFNSESMVQAGTSAADATESGPTERRAIKAAKILRPRTVHEFYHMLAVWQMICQAVSIASSLATGAFLEQVVHEQVAKNQLTWQQAHELFLVYLEAVETAPEGSGLTIANVYASGGHDMYRERAMMRAKEMFKGGDDRDKGIFRGGKGEGK